MVQLTLIVDPRAVLKSSTHLVKSLKIKFVLNANSKIKEIKIYLFNSLNDFVLTFALRSSWNLSKILFFGINECISNA